MDSAPSAIVAVDPHDRLLLHLSDLAAQGIRVLAIEPNRPLDRILCLAIDSRSAVLDAFRVLHDSGHRTIGIINEQQNHMGLRQAFLGYLDGCREFNLPIHPNAIVQVGDTGTVTHQPDIKAVTGWISTTLGGVQILAQACQSTGLSIPEDVSVISLDDPGEDKPAWMDRAVSVVRPEFSAYGKKIHKSLSDWREDCLGQIVPIPSVWVDRETVSKASPLK